MNTRTIRVESLTRVEGEALLHIDIEDGTVRDVRFGIFEPPRLFEALLRGRSYQDVPDLTARICGICPVAYQLSACAALEEALGVRLEEGVRELRSLLYCGEWIASHALHIHLLHAPDFLGVESAFAVAGADAARVEAGLQLKQAGSAILEVLGGRATHPVNVRVGGFHRIPSVREVHSLHARLVDALRLARETVQWVSAFSFPTIATAPVLVALDGAGAYPMLGGRLTSTAGLDLTADAFGTELREEQVGHSTAKQAHLPTHELYAVGPLARHRLYAHRLSRAAREAAAEAGLLPMEVNPYRSIIVRAVEIVHACAEALRLIEAYAPPRGEQAPVTPRAGTGHGWTEAPRGVLWHRYVLDEQGRVESAEIVPPTSQNQRAVEADMRAIVTANLTLDDDTLSRVCEQAVRNHDPCISCATHAVRVRVHRR